MVRNRKLFKKWKSGGFPAPLPSEETDAAKQNRESCARERAAFSFSMLRWLQANLIYYRAPRTHLDGNKRGVSSKLCVWALLQMSDDQTGFQNKAPCERSLSPTHLWCSTGRLLHLSPALLVLVLYTLHAVLLLYWLFRCVRFWFHPQIKCF